MLIRDMFTGEERPPQIPVKFAQPPSGTIGFDAFWFAYPTGPRKVAKKQCFAKWIKQGCANDAELIRIHVEWLKTQPDWLKDGGAFICAPLVYLNQARWLDWEPPKVKTASADSALRKIIEDQAKAAPMPDAVRELRQKLRA